MQRTILHVGTHKTGTTTIQHFASANRAALAKRGLIYPRFGQLSLRRQVAHHDLARAFSSDSRAIPLLVYARSFVKKISGKYVGDETVFISAEPFYRHIYSSDPNDDIWKKREAYIARMAEAFASIKPEILIVFRRRDEFAESLYQEIVKTRGYSSSFDVFFKEREHFFEYCRQLELYEKYFQKVTVYIFEDLAGSKFIDDFFEKIGISTADLPRDKVRNKGWPLDLVLYARELFEASGKKDRIRIGRAISDWLSQVKRTPPHAKLFSPSERRAFLKKYKEDDAGVLKRLNQPGRSTLFPTDVSDLPGKRQLSNYERAEISSKLFTHILRRGKTRELKTITSSVSESLRRLIGRD